MKKNTLNLLSLFHKNAKKKILIVDDEPEIHESIENYFIEANLSYEIIRAPNGNIALKIIEKSLPDLIISDWEMPGMTGIELIKQIKNSERTADVPTIMCTGVMTSSENLETALEAGAVDYIRKPIDKVELIARTKANLHLAESYKRIKKLNESKNNIFSIISHDLRTPAANIGSFIDLILSMQEEYDKEEILKSLELIREQSTSMFTILENLLNWANSQRNNVHFSPEMQEFLPIVKAEQQLLKDIAAKKKINIEIAVPDSCKLKFDTVLISAVVRNLISNAIKFTPENGKIRVEAKKQDDYLQIAVSDNGVGISPEKLKRILDKTVYECTYGTNNEKGSGLGLKLCIDFIELHNGKIWAKSEPDKGSTFFFSLPI